MPSERILSIKEIEEQASAGVKVYRNITLKTHLRTVSTMLQQANSYKKEGNFQEAYKFYMRFAIMALEKLPEEHPEYKKLKYKPDIIVLNKNAHKVLEEIAALKPALEEKFNVYKRVQEEAFRNKVELRLKEEQHGNELTEKPNESSGETFKIQENWSLMEELKDTNLRQSDARTEISYKEKDTSTETRISYPGVSDHNQSDGYSYSATIPIGSTTIQNAPFMTYQPSFPQPHPISHHQIPSPYTVSSAIPHSSPPPATFTAPHMPIAAPPFAIGPPSYPFQPPALPPKVPRDTRPSLAHRPPLPPKPSGYLSDAYFTNNSSTEPLKKEEFAHDVEFQDYTEGGEPLRGISVPLDIAKKFLRIASPNTKKNLETCGILAGTLSQNSFCITTLIIPKQTATSDTCTATNEEEFCEFQDENNLLMLGWIHTHPTQTCFMSSMDLHTHSSYQMILPEAIAIVCAPKYKEVGIFRLTSPPGLQIVLNCEERGFHPHPNEFNICKNLNEWPSHVVMKDMDVNVVDLR
ncbi:hypothetical protein G9A89_017001 [Geosiphon pyriformis]|nr:hypothetical protein G9A89_017001 [Geosiphon pyriformis]